MDAYKSFYQKLFQVDHASFDEFALQLFKYQAEHNAIYKEYIHHLGIQVNNVRSVRQIPYLPISFFKNHEIKTGEWKEMAVFESSGTTSDTTSKHFLRDISLYRKNTEIAFRHAYDKFEAYHFFALLPSYLERSNSSLVMMADFFIKNSNSGLGGFYLDDLALLVRNIEAAGKTNRKIFLIGVSFALLDLAERFEIDLSNAIVMETGGMKGRRKEMTRFELHSTLNGAFGTDVIHSEYGMTELLSQAYSKGNGYFQTSNLMKVILRDLNDPFDMSVPVNKTGGINVIDLANIDTCSFIETQDIGRYSDQGLFEVLGRFDNSDIRGCNLMIA